MGPPSTMPNGPYVQVFEAFVGMPEYVARREPCKMIPLGFFYIEEYYQGMTEVNARREWKS